MIFRDDDISYLTRLDDFKKVHDIFIRYDVIHDIALICERIEENPELVEYILNNNIGVHIHCWRHVAFTDNHALLAEHFDLCKKKIEEVFKQTPKYIFPPWNKSDSFVEATAKAAGLEVSNQKISLSQYVRANGDVKESVINFHYWAHSDIIFLEPALYIFKSKSK